MINKLFHNVDKLALKGFFPVSYEATLLLNRSFDIVGSKENVSKLGSNIILADFK
jgi:hypothetical protein